jgi:predicted  nucleic acid-binding Zn-ribbon protein
LLPELNNLTSLQAVDLEIRALTQVQQEIPANMRGLESKLAEIQADTAEKEETLEENSIASWKRKWPCSMKA